MDLNSKNIQLQFEGFCKTPSLWKNANIFDLDQYELKNSSITTFEGEIPKNLRLGKRVERFVAHQLKQDASITILAENIQIQNGKTTVGEIDFILLQNQIPIHLEVVYKFYLYHEAIGSSEIGHWIGPNKKDSLVEKLTKLKQKQLPLLYNIHTKPLINKLNLSIDKIQQKVIFKAQLFIPYQFKKTESNFINSNYIVGFYISLQELVNFTNCKFYIPEKINWLQEIQIQVKWLSYNQFLPKIEVILNEKIAPLCWVKQPNGEVQKVFIIWWN